MMEILENEIEVLIADDQPVVRQGLRQFIDNSPGLKVVAEAGNGQEALALLRRLRPHIALLDIDMPVLDGFGVMNALHAEKSDTKVIFLTVHREGSILSKAISIGAQGYILKDSPLPDIIAAVRSVAAGEPYVSPTVANQLLNYHRTSQQNLNLANLTPAERAILKLIAEYKTTKEIASSLSISVRTAETHRANICAKLGLRGSHSLIKFALAHQDELY